MVLSSCGWITTPVTVGGAVDEDEAEDDVLLALELDEELVGVGPEWAALMISAARSDWNVT
jgi:hypothetical protein